MRSLALSALPLTLLAACESSYVTIAPDVSAAAARLGPAIGSASSNLALAYPPWLPCLCFIPWGWDARAQTAYGSAVAGVPGATALDNVTIRENWSWWLLGTTRSLTIHGDAVRQ